MHPAIFRTSAETAAFCSQCRRDGKTIGLVPTMGALHEGHLSLVRRAREENDVVVVSIFVNPTQFGPNEDLDKYPRTFENDVALCGSLGTDAIFAPAPADVYPDGYATYIVQERLTAVLCGADRPTHFRGVLTVCCKLFNIIAPTVAYFGQKDYQQTVVIRRMVADLCLPLRIEVCPTVREPDGLAKSSRNRYLSDSERVDARCLSRALELARTMIAQGETDAWAVVNALKNLIATTKSAKIGYVAVAHPETLEPVERIEGTVLVALAVTIGGTRLIDNALIEAPTA